MTEAKAYGRAAEPDHYKMDFNVAGKPHTFYIKRQRFEGTVDKMDKDIHRGKDLKHFITKFGDHFAQAPHPTSKPAVQKVKDAIKKVAQDTSPATTGHFDKAEHVQNTIRHAPLGHTPGMLAKHASESSMGRLSMANARYLVNKHLAKK
jgi:hypothetical protein